MKNKFRKGFTLIELLLVIVVVAILAGTVMVAGDESLISAEANNIINNMRVLKTAALEWIADYGDYIQQTNVQSAGLDRELYMVTYPFPAVKAGNMENMDNDKARWHIQNVMKSDQDGRATMMKYIKINPSISINKDTNAPYALEGGYAIVDSSGGYNDGEKNIWSSGIPGLRKWFVVYQFENKDNSHVKKLKKKIAERVNEFELLENEKDPNR